MWGRREDKVMASSMLSITEEGKKAMQQDSVQDNVARDVLSKLEEHSPQSISCIANEMGINTDEVKGRVEIMARQGLVVIRR